MIFQETGGKTFGRNSHHVRRRAGGVETQKQIVRWNGRIQTVCVACIIGIMGVNLGSMEGFAEKITAMGGESLLFAVVPTALSAAAVWLCRGKISGKERS